ncbi:MAG: protein serine/threonine phosphatase [Bacteroidetes bacterium]|jgi:serine phosphatase RsbU (regulator of sigma subunit)|nr:protein serine/threonine phosphatase [Bacteroidota bacterium]MDF2452968.1 protein serine/threonine phosphatase [Bacteroidota bacterium]
MFKNFILFILLINQINVISQVQRGIDSILFEIQTKPLNKSIADKALAIPYDITVNNLNKSFFIYERLYNENIFGEDKIRSGDLIEKLALVYYLKGNYLASYNMHLKSIQLFEEAGDERRKANVMATLAYASKKRNLKASLEMMANAIRILKKLNAKSDLTSAIDNYGVLFEIKGDLDSAMFFYNEALRLKVALNDSVGIPYSLNNIAGIYFIKKNFSEGLAYINRSTEIRNKLHDYIGMAWNEHTLGELYVSLGNNNEAREHFRKSFQLAKKASYPDLQSRNAKQLSSVFAKGSRFDSAYFYFNTFFDIHDSLYNEQTQKQLLEMETLYETEKKSSQIVTLASKNAVIEKEIEKKRNSQLFLLSILGLCLIGGIVIFRAYRQKTAANKIISSQKIEVEKHRNLIAEKQKETIDSINYAKRIQYALLANEALLQRNLKEHFIFFKPKDIVSGDFYWATEHNDRFYLAVCDSTGHGVPGAFMSLLNIGFLNEAIKEKEIREPNEIFNYVRNRLIESISHEEQQDGMDGILICFDKGSGQITYAAANNAPILIKSNGSSAHFIELGKDKMPIGKGERLEPYILFSIAANAGDCLYLYTDGFADQFGGPKGKKFKYNPLNQLLSSNSNEEMNNQKMKLEQTLTLWQRELEQVDDILIIGFRI